jgi:protein-S-isoprenylcysteine O-methyltransferase Ste14
MMSTLSPVIAIILVLAVAALGMTMALFPAGANRVRMRFPFQLVSPDWYIRAIGIVFAGLGIAFAVVIGFLSRWW